MSDRLEESNSNINHINEGLKDEEEEEKEQR